MKPMVISGLYPGQQLEGVARVMDLREEELDGEAVHVLGLANGTGAVQAFIPFIRDVRERPKVSDLVHVSGVLESLWEGGAVALRLDTIQKIDARDLLPRQNRPRQVEPSPDEGEGLLIELPHAFAAYLLWLITRDLARWTEERRSRLTQDDVRGLALFLHDQLPVAVRSPLPARAPAKRTRARQAA